MDSLIHSNPLLLLYLGTGPTSCNSKSEEGNTKAKIQADKGDLFPHSFTQVTLSETQSAVFGEPGVGYFL